MKRVRTIHKSTSVNGTVYHFAPLDDGVFYEGDVPDDVCEILMAAKRVLGKTSKTDWQLVPSLPEPPKPEPKVEKEPEPKPEPKEDKKAKK
jgi:hypothetical protein